ncbi:unnamed protein product [Moneuplotes crassus]|uniref:Uncharacterized protein n=1 Tax=Euplotes crassus TaxID=5936 RepID=A0AAD2D307_EUPCR|nr:unnamed protein product [Moneuplotes crassus]
MESSKQKPELEGGTKENPIKYESSYMSEAKKMYEDLDPHPKEQLQLGKMSSYTQRDKLFYPGKSEGQPFRRDPYHYCYSITKPPGKNSYNAGDAFDNFISQADQSINHFENYLIRDNPHNPLGLKATFTINIVEKSYFEKMKFQAKKEGVDVDDIIAYEGCPGDDITILGGKESFLSHFCTFFKFNACYGVHDRKISEKLSDADRVGEKLNGWLEKME